MAGLGFPVNGTRQEQSDWTRQQLERGRSSGGYIGTVKERWDDSTDAGKAFYNGVGYLADAIAAGGYALKDAATSDAGLNANPAYRYFRDTAKVLHSLSKVGQPVIGAASQLDASDASPPVSQRATTPVSPPMRAHSSGPGTPPDGNQAARNVAPAQQATQQDEQARRQPDQGTYRGGLLGVYRDRWDDVKRHYNDDGLLGGIGAGIRNWNGAAVDTILAPYSAGLDALTSEPAKAFYRGITGKERPAASPTSVQGQAGTTVQSSQVQQSKAAGAVPSQPSQAAANAAEQARASGAKEQRQHPGEARYGTYVKPTWFDVEGSNGKVRVGYWDVDGTRQTLVRHGTFPEKSQAQPQQPRGLHYVPGGWANDGYSFEGSAEDRARFFAPVPRPYNHAPRSDNDTFLALQRQKAMQPVEQPLPERPEFPTDRRMGWHTKLAKYQADMDAYNRQMANIAGYRQAMDVAALQQMPKPTDPVEQARLERALALQERQAAQQAAYQQAQLDQQGRMNQYNQMTGMADYFTKMNQLGYQQREAELVDNYRRALLAGDAKAADAAKAVLEVYRGKEVKDDNKNGKFAHATSEDAMGNKKIVIYNTRNGEVVNDANIPSMDTPEAVKMRQDNSAYLEEVKKRASPKQQEELAGLEPFINHPNFKAMVDEYMRKGR